MSQETHEILFKTNYNEVKKAEQEMKVFVSQSITDDKIRKNASDTLKDTEKTNNKLKLEDEKLTNKIALIDYNETLKKKREFSKLFDQAILEDRKRTNAQLKSQAEEDLINKSAANKLRDAANSNFAANQPPPGQISNWRGLTLAIKETRGELVRLTSEGKTGGAEWDRYSNKLRELVRQKQLVQRETRLTSQQLLAMSRDLTVVAYGIRTIATDVISLGDGKKSAGELALAIGGIGIQTLTVLPAIHGLTKALEAAGIVSASTIARLGAFSTMLSTVTAGIAVVTAAYGTMAGAITHVGDVLDRLGKVLSGSLGYWEAVKENIRDVTFGLLDFTAASDSFDSSNVQQQLSDLAYVANFTANAFADLKKQVDIALQTNIDRVLEHARLFKDPISFNGPEISDQDRLRLKEQYEKQKTSRGPGTRTQKEKAEELNFLEQYRKKIADIEKEIASLNLLSADANTTDREKLVIQDELIKKQKELNELKRQGGLGDLPNAKTLDKLLEQNLGIRQAGITRNPRDAEITLQEEMTKREEERLSFASQIYDKTKGMLTDFGLMKGTTAQIVNYLESLINGLGKGFGIVSSIIGFITNPIGTVIGGASGGGTASLSANPLTGGNMNRVNVKIYNPITLREGLRVETRIDNMRGGIDL